MQLRNWPVDPRSGPHDQLFIHNREIVSYSKACRPGGHCWDYNPGAIPLSQLSAIHLKIKHP